MKQVIVDNGKGQGAWGLGSTWEEAAENAKKEWHGSFGIGTKPARVRLCESAEVGWNTVLDEAPFRNWGRGLSKLYPLTAQVSS